MYHFYGHTVKGVKSHQNDDCYLINKHVSQETMHEGKSNKNEFVVGVADGVGSSPHGSFAAKFLLDEIARHKNQLTHSLILNIINNTHAYLLKTFNNLASSVFTIIHSTGEFITIYHVGDTRVYKLTKRNLVQLTNDHTHVQELINLGAIGEGMRYNHPQKNIIQQSLGGTKKIHIDTYRNIFEPGEKILLTSDGIHDYITSEDIETILRKSVNLKTNITTLIDKALLNGSKDDLTAVAIKFT